MTCIHKIEQFLLARYNSTADVPPLPACIGKPFDLCSEPIADGPLPQFELGDDERHESDLTVQD